MHRAPWPHTVLLRLLTTKHAQMPIWIWTLLIFGGTLMTALMCWLAYLKFYLAPKTPGTASAFPAEPTAGHAAPVAAEGRGSEADTFARAAMAAAAHATAAAHRFLFGDSGATLSDGSTYSIWGRQMAGYAKSKVTEEAAAGSTTGNAAEKEREERRSSSSDRRTPHSAPAAAVASVDAASVKAVAS